jgi:starch synthase
VEFRDAKAELLASYNDHFDFEEMGKLAIDYSDGIVISTPKVNKTLEQYAIGKKKPLLGYHEDFADAYEEFYNQICPEDE